MTRPWPENKANYLSRGDRANGIREPNLCNIVFNNRKWKTKSKSKTKSSWSWKHEHSFRVSAFNEWANPHPSLCHSTHNWKKTGYKRSPLLIQLRRSSCDLWQKYWESILKTILVSDRSSRLVQIRTVLAEIVVATSKLHSFKIAHLSIDANVSHETVEIWFQQNSACMDFNIAHQRHSCKKHPDIRSPNYKSKIKNQKSNQIEWYAIFPNTQHVSPVSKNAAKFEAECPRPSVSQHCEKIR